MKNKLYDQLYSEFNGSPSRVEPRYLSLMMPSEFLNIRSYVCVIINKKYLLYLMKDANYIIRMVANNRITHE